MDYSAPAEPASAGDDQLSRVIKEFATLKSNEGLTALKLNQCPSIMRTMGEMYPDTAVGRLVSDIAELGQSRPHEATALAHALNCAYVQPRGATLEARRRNAGIPPTTAKEREARAARELYAKWVRQQGESDLASIFFLTSVASFPTHAAVKLGAVDVDIAVGVVRSESTATEATVVLLHTGTPPAAMDYLVLESTDMSGSLTYGVDQQDWRLQIQMPPFVGDAVHIRRPNIETLLHIRIDHAGTYEVHTAEVFEAGPKPEIVIRREQFHGNKIPISWWWQQQQPTGGVTP